MGDLAGYLNDNKEWLFGGVGLTILSIGGLALRRLLSRQSPPSRDLGGSEEKDGSAGVTFIGSPIKAKGNVTVVGGSVISSHDRENNR